MSKKIIAFGDNEIEKRKFRCYKNPNFKKELDVDNILISKEISSGEKNYKYFIGYVDNDYKIKPVHTMLSKTSAYVKSCDGETKWMYFFD